MKLVKQNTEKHRAVYRLENGNFKKVWFQKDLNWLLDHVSILNRLIPNYVIEGGSYNNTIYIIVRQLPGIPANICEHTDEFIKFVYESCLQNIKETAPFYHGDYVLSNMFVDDNKLYFCDWDNVGLHDYNFIMQKMHKDLYSAFGDKFKEIANVNTTDF